MMCKVIRFDTIVRQSKTIKVRFYEDLPKATAVSAIGIYKVNGNPAAYVEASGNDYIFMLTKGFEIHLFNEFLRSLKLGFEIEFVNYKQYAELIVVCNQIIQKRNSENPVILLK